MTTPKKAPKNRRRMRGDGTVSYDEKRARWIGRVWLDDRRHQVSAKTQADAARKLGALIHDPTQHNRDRTLTVAAATWEWFDKSLPARNLAPATIDAYRWAVAALVGPHGKPGGILGSKRAADLTARQIERGFTKLHNDGMGRSSLVKLRSTLSQTMRWHVTRGELPRNPVDGVELPRDEAQDTDRRALTADELKALLDALEGHPRRAMYAAMGLLGLRPGEAAGLCRDAVDLGAGTLTVRRSVRSNRGRPFLTDDLKTKSSHRCIEMPGRLRDMLAEHVARAGAKGDDLLFPSDTGSPMYASTMRAELREAADKAKIGKVRPVELRHTATTIMVDTMPTHKVADVLGHTTTRMIEANYRHRPDLIAAIDVLDGVE